MRLRTLLLLSVCFLINFSSKANNLIGLTFQEYQLVISIQNNNVSDTIVDETELATPVKFHRGKAILFTIFTGFLGGHRIYLGTHQRTPIIYSVTLGGLGILPLIDLVQIIFTKDLSKFENNPKVIMWGK